MNNLKPPQSLPTHRPWTWSLDASREQIRPTSSLLLLSSRPSVKKPPQASPNSEPWINLWTDSTHKFARVYSSLFSTLSVLHNPTITNPCMVGKLDILFLDFSLSPNLENLFYLSGSFPKLTLASRATAGFHDT